MSTSPFGDAEKYRLRLRNRHRHRLRHGRRTSHDRRLLRFISDDRTAHSTVNSRQGSPSNRKKKFEEQVGSNLIWIALRVKFESGNDDGPGANPRLRRHSLARPVSRIKFKPVTDVSHKSNIRFRCVFFVLCAASPIEVSTQSSVLFWIKYSFYEANTALDANCQSGRGVRGSGRVDRRIGSGRDFYRSRRIRSGRIGSRFRRKIKLCANRIDPRIGSSGVFFYRIRRIRSGRVNFVVVAHRTNIYDESGHVRSRVWLRYIFFCK